MSLIFYNVRLIIQYDGTKFFGWQRQKQLRTVEKILTDAIIQIVNHPVEVIAAGRTDRGVHAFGQVVNFYTYSLISPDNLILALNSFLPFDIRILHAEYVTKDFHSRFSAKKREYSYFIYLGRVCPPFRYFYVNHFYHSLDIEKLSHSLSYFLGEHDFSSFCSAKDLSFNKKCIIYDFRIENNSDDLVIFIQANRFLRKMVRMIVGFLLAVNSKNIDFKNELDTIFAFRDRKLNNYPTASPRGLFLNRVFY